jgi:hypothetical protein
MVADYYDARGLDPEGRVTSADLVDLFLDV